MPLNRSFWIVALALVAGAGAAVAQRDFSKVEIQPTQVGDGIWMMQGAGGNLGVCAGTDGVLLIDDQFAELSEKIRAAIQAVSKEPLRFVLNTHFHGDHTGGNENMANAGALLVAHDNVRRRMSTEQYNALFDRKTPPAPAKALPLITFDDSLSFHVNGQEVRCFHVAPAHTDGDVVVWFPKANVIHAGDCVFNGLYPVIDVSAGGSVDGMIAATAKIVALAREDTKIIPGHGPLATRADVQAFHDMMVTARGRMKKLIAQKKTLEEIQAAKPLADFDSKWGQGGMKAETFLKAMDYTLRKR